MKERSRRETFFSVLPYVLLGYALLVVLAAVALSWARHWPNWG